MTNLPEPPKTDIESFTAAYMTACKDRPSDWNEIGYWYARQLWDAAVKQEREECAQACEKRAMDTVPDDSALDQLYYAAAEIRARP